VTGGWHAPLEVTPTFTATAFEHSGRTFLHYEQTGVNAVSDRFPTEPRTTPVNDQVGVCRFPTDDDGGDVPPMLVVCLTRVAPPRAFRLTLAFIAAYPTPRDGRDLNSRTPRVSVPRGRTDHGAEPAGPEIYLSAGGCHRDDGH